MKSGIYIIRNLINNKIYLGSAVNLKRRFYEHKTRLRIGTHHNEILQRSWNKYGEENFYFQILEHLEETKLLQRETELIWALDCDNKNKGYNFCKVGRNHLGVKRDPKVGAKISAALKGRAVPEERKRKISASLKGKPLSEERRKKLTGLRRGKYTYKNAEQRNKNISKALLTSSKCIDNKQRRQDKMNAMLKGIPIIVQQRNI